MPVHLATVWAMSSSSTSSFSMRPALPSSARRAFSASAFRSSSCSVP
jgi:hypothetical protein